MFGDQYRYPETGGFSLVPPAASAFAQDYDQVFWYITVVTVVASLVVYGMLAWFCFRYTRTGPGQQTPRILGSVKVEIAWTVIPLAFFLSFYVLGIRLYNEQVQTPTDAAEYFVVGKQWMWKIQHPDGQREINELHLPVNTTVKVTGTSEDVLHDFGIPAFRSKIDVIPGRYVTTWYRPTVPGTYHIFCDQYCGMGHSQMIGKVHVLTQADYEAFKEGTYRVNTPGKNPVDGSPAWEGRKLFLKLQCNACHNNESQARAPRLEAMYGGNRPLQGGSMQKFDDEYIRQSIRNPMAKVADGWKPIMPAFPVGQVDEIELRNLVAYVKSLKLGDLPTRTENAPAPEGAPTTPTEGVPPAQPEGGKK
jgi:cytochrome c oxidase subunit 2